MPRRLEMAEMDIQLLGGRMDKKWQHSNSCTTKRSPDNEMWQLWPQSPTVTNVLQSAFSSDSCGFPWLGPANPIFLMSPHLPWLCPHTCPGSDHTPALASSLAHLAHINSNHLQHKSLLFHNPLCLFYVQLLGQIWFLRQMSFLPPSQFCSSVTQH